MNFQKYIYLFLLLGGQITGFAQSADPLAHAQHEIWTETALFVYRDANLKEPASIAEAANLKQLVEAIKKEDSKSQIYSKVYKPIEETGTYKSGKDLKTKLDLLIASIQRKLRENEQRMNNIDRRQRLNEMIKQLQQIASDYTSPTPSPTAVAPAGDIIDSTETTDARSTAVSSQTVPDSVDENEAENQLSSLSKKQNTAKNIDWMSTLALILGVINLGLVYALFKGIGKANTRLDQRKKEIETLTAQLNALDRKGSGGPDSPGKLTMSAVESMVQKTITREMAKFNSPAAPIRETPAPPSQLVASSDDRPIKMAQPTKPVVEAQMPEAPELTPPPAPVPPAPEKPQSYFARVPVNGGFHEQDLYPSQQHDSIYEIRLSKNDPNKAGFRIVLNKNVHRTAIESAYLSLKDACNYQLNNQHATTIITDKTGVLTLENGIWKIDKKAEIHFE